jgi:V/A-type H+-transporting ATPase subunit E
MEVQLQELLDKIKNEGVKAAEAEAARIREEAEKRSRDAIQRAEQQAAEIVARAREEAARFEQTSREAVKQAARNAILGVRQGVVGIFDALLARETREALSAQNLTEVIVALVKAWPEKQIASLEALLPPEDLKKLEKGLKARLVEELKKGFELKPLAALEAGFRIAMKDGSAYYNFTDQGIAQILAEYLNPRIAGLMSQAAAD